MISLQEATKKKIQPTWYYGGSKVLRIKQKFVWMNKKNYLLLKKFWNCELLLYFCQPNLTVILSPGGSSKRIFNFLSSYTWLFDERKKILVNSIILGVSFTLSKFSFYHMQWWKKFKFVNGTAKELEWTNFFPAPRLRQSFFQISLLYLIWGLCRV